MIACFFFSSRTILSHNLTQGTLLTEEGDISMTKIILFGLKTISRTICFLLRFLIFIFFFKLVFPSILFLFLFLFHFFVYQNTIDQHSISISVKNSMIVCKFFAFAEIM